MAGHIGGTCTFTKGLVQRVAGTSGGLGYQEPGEVH